MDQDCDGASDYDADADGVDSNEHGGTDCDDSDSTVYPGAEEDYDDDIDQDCDGRADTAGADCSADLLVEMDDGTTTTIDGCLTWDFQANFEYDPDDPPEVLDFSLRLGGTTAADFDCEVSIEQEGVCGPGYYSQGPGGGTTSIVLLDCTGVGDDYEVSVTATEGYLHLETISAGSVSGSFAGQPIETTLVGTLDVTSASAGVRVSGDIALTLAQVAGDGEEQTDCQGSSGDEDEDGAIDTVFGGDDCDDTNPDLNTDDADGDGVTTCDDDCNDDDATTGPGFAASDDATACMTDADGDGWGSLSPSSGARSGTDCDDADAALNNDDSDSDGQGTCDGDCDDTDNSAYLGAASEEASLCTIDADADGCGDDALTSPYDAGTDCDDTEPTAHPAAAREEPTLCTIDADSDGYGDDTLVSPYDAGTDCDDTTSSTSPSANEVCDSADTDEDCDGLADDDDPGEIYESSLSTFYADLDGDGYGDPDNEVLACDASSAHVADNTDCDDSTTLASPGITSETCGDGLDNDCDGASSEDEGCGIAGEIAASDVAYTQYPGSGSTLGQIIRSVGDIDGSGDEDVLVGCYLCPDSSSTGSQRGNAYLFLGPATSSGTTFEDLSNVVTFRPESNGDRLGLGIAGGHDLTGDGVADVVAGARYNDNTSNNAGTGYIFAGPFSAGATHYASAAAVELGGTGNDDFAFGALASVGDVDGDGNPDLLVGAAHAENGSFPTDAGEAYLLLGPLTGDMNLSAADVTWQGDTAYDYFGGAVDTVGDLNGDGHPELALGAASQDDGGSGAGALYLVYGPASSGGSIASAADATVTGATAGDGLSPGIAALGDMNGDGADDFAVSAPKTSAGGTIYLFYGALSSSVSAATADATLEQSVSGNGAGYTLTAAGDVDGDGNLDVAMGDSGAEGMGKVYVWLGPVSGTHDLEDAAIRFTGATAESFGWGLAPIGDADGDGQDDLFVSSQNDSTANSSAGTMYVLTGMGEGI